MYELTIISKRKPIILSFYKDEYFIFIVLLYQCQFVYPVASLLIIEMTILQVFFLTQLNDNL